VRHLVLIPSFNSGPKLVQTACAALLAWPDVWVVVDGSTDRSGGALLAEAGGEAGLRVLVLPRNRGKGGAVLHGLRLAAEKGFTHVLTMDADGQHPAERIPAFMAASRADPQAMVLGLPVFGPDAPSFRVHGRRVSNWWVGLETGWAGIGDSLCGFRVYPIAPLLEAMGETRWMRRFDFDPEAAVRLSWRGVRAVNLPAPVRYLSTAEGGVSHFRYLRDNALLTWMHMRLVAGALRRLPALLRQRGAPSRPASPAAATPP
jgi:glycosyltransferase involved in cell wall biosynthesis